MKINDKKLLKGGSLAGTYLINTSEGEYVRKEISLKTNREYGYQRWYSQLKRLQRYEVLFPDLFPRVLRFGEEGGNAYFDIEYFPEALNCFDYLKNYAKEDTIKRIFDLIVEGMNLLHSVKIQSCADSIRLYHREEITQKLEDCWGNRAFKEYALTSTVDFQGHKVPSLYSMLTEYEEFGARCYRELSQVEESYTHGNITLENILYCPQTNKVVFIDPYEENIIDNKYNEYSQLLQSCSSHYEIFNEASPENYDNLSIPRGIQIFNDLFTTFLKDHLSPEELKVVRYFEASQFVRMLPFKIKVAPLKAFLFYGVASFLVHNLLSDSSEK